MSRSLIPLLVFGSLSVFTAEWAHGTSVSSNLDIVVTHTNSTASTCPQGTTYVSAGDGCGGAQASGSWQAPNFFSGYVGYSYPAVGGCNVGGYCRPPWNVAGVDYPIGYSGTLADAGNSANLLAHSTPSGCASWRPSNGSNSNEVHINSHPCTLSHLDFTGVGTGHGCIAIIDGAGAGNVTLDNVHVAWIPDSFTSQPSSCQETQALVSFSGNNAATVIIRYSQFNDSHSSATAHAETIFCGCASFAFSYSVCIDTVQHCVNGGPLSFVMQYSYGEGFGSQARGAHGNWDYLSRSGSQITFLDQFNTRWSSPSSNATTLSEMRNDVGNWDSTSQYNVEIGSARNAYMWAIEGTGTVAAVNEIINNNYYDPTGTLSWLNENASSASSVANKSCTGNINLLTGARQTGTQGSGAAALTCN